MDETTHTELREMEGRIRADIASLHTRLDRTDTRTAALEALAAVHSVRIGAVEENLKPFPVLCERVGKIEARVGVYAAAISSVAWWLLDWIKK